MAAVASGVGAIQKVVLITGGSKGLGAQCARVFAPDYRVIINYANDASRANELLSSLSEIPSTHASPATDKPRFLALRADMASRSEINQLVESAVDQMGRLDVVVSNHGWTRMTNFMDLNDNVVDEDWDRCFNLNVKSHLFLMHAAKQHLEQTEGAFITTASVAGVKPSGSSLAYSVTKAAQIHLSRGLAAICSPKIRVNTVSPGMLLTEWGMQFPESKREAARNNTKLKRLATVEDVAQQVRTLALSQSQTGTNIIIDSGSSM